MMLVAFIAFMLIVIVTTVTLVILRLRKHVTSTSTKCPDDIFVPFVGENDPSTYSTYTYSQCQNIQGGLANMYQCIKQYNPIQYKECTGWGINKPAKSETTTTSIEQCRYNCSRIFGADMCKYYVWEPSTGKCTNYYNSDSISISDAVPTSGSILGHPYPMNNVKPT